MCLFTRWKKPKIATEDIVVYKILSVYSTHLASPYMNFVYDLDRLYETKFTKSKSCSGTGLYIYIMVFMHMYLRNQLLLPILIVISALMKEYTNV